MNFTIHLRLTKACNADCTYCSSWQSAPDKYMSAKEALESLRFILDSYMNKTRTYTSSLTVQYLGGEILTIPLGDLKDIVYSIREECSTRGINLVDGVQTNLIASTRRVNELSDLFNGRIGSSVEYSAKNRTVSGSAERYMSTFESNAEIFSGSPSFGVVFTADSKTIQNSEYEYMKARDNNRNFTMRVVYEGGRDVDFVSPTQYSDALCVLLDRWFLEPGFVVEPLFDMVYSRLQELEPIFGSSCSACNRQSDCTSKSINIEPNGDLYLCMEMADAGIYKIGNALDQTIDVGNWAKLAGRKHYVAQQCRSCDYYTSCQGGCMVESYQQVGSIQDKTPYCEAYKTVFAKIDEMITTHGTSVVYDWLNPMISKHHNEGSSRGF